MIMEQDYFCGAKFGHGDHLEVVGWKPSNNGRYKKYIVKCRVCALDTELFGEGLFETEKGSLVKGKIPCGCSKYYSPTESQFLILCDRAARTAKFKFIGLAEDYKGKNTKLLLLCGNGHFSKEILYSYQAFGGRCKECVNERVRLKEDEMVRRCMSTGNFPEGTTFKRYLDYSNKSPSLFWKVYCPDCEEVSISRAHNLMNGHRPCSCRRSYSPPSFAYIDYIMSSHLGPFSIKFGITNFPAKRLHSLTRDCTYIVQPSSLWYFEDTGLCRQAERLCRDTVERRFLSKEELPFGWTETTYLQNEDAIEKIFMDFGGVRLTESG